MGSTKASDRQLPAVIEREQQIIEWRSQGVSFVEIGRRLGVSGIRARQVFDRGLTRIPAAKVHEYRVAQLAEIDVLKQKLWEVIDNPNTSGRTVAESVSVWVRLMERGAKVMGSDKPVRNEHVIFSPEQVAAEIRRLQADNLLRAQEAGLEPPALKPRLELLG